MILKLNSHSCTFLLVLATALIAMGAVAGDLEVEFHWQSCPSLAQYGQQMGPADHYQVWVSRNGEAAQLTATTPDTFIVMSVPIGQDVRVRVQGVDADGVKSLMSDWSQPVYFEVGAGVPAQVAYLKANYPNPFNPETTLRYRVPENLAPDAPLALEIYDVRGQRVRRLPVERSAGMHEVRWDGRDHTGGQVASGTYLARMVVGAMIETGKMTLTKYLPLSLRDRNA